MNYKRIKHVFCLLFLCIVLAVSGTGYAQAAMKISKKSISLKVGKTYKLKVKGITGKVKWSSSNKKVASVSQKGVIKARKGGKATITAKAGKQKVSCIVYVPTIKLSRNSVNLMKGKSLDLKAAVTGKYKKVAWKSSNTKVAKVSGKGKVTAVGAGKATITAKANGITAKCKVTVEKVTISLDKTLVSLEKNETITLKAITTGTESAVKWSSSDFMIADVDSSGLVTGYDYGGAAITAEVDGIKASCVVRVSYITDVVSLDAGRDHAAFIKTDGSLWTWGQNVSGPLGTGREESEETPVKVMTGVKSVSCGYDHTLVVKSDGTLWVCGANYEGCLGFPRNKSYYDFINIMSGVVKATGGAEHTAILKKDGTLWTCGWNGHGQLGDVGDTNEPAKVMDGVKDVSTGHYHTAVLKTDNSVWTFGMNSRGQLGRDKDLNSVPGKVMDSVKAVEAAGAITAIIKNDGSLWMCGGNWKGQLGDGTTIDRKTPVKIMNDVKSVKAGNEHTLILKTDGTLWGCGNNEDFQLGINQIRTSTPVKIMSDVKAIAAEDEYSLILRNDGSVWMFGKLV